MSLQAREMILYIFKSEYRYLKLQVKVKNKNWNYVFVCTNNRPYSEFQKRKMFTNRVNDYVCIVIK